MRWIALTTAALLCACGTDGDARVRIDVSALWLQGAQSVNSIEVRVFDSAGNHQYTQYLASVDDTAVLEIIAGPDLRFEVEAMTASQAPSYWGEVVRTIAAGDAIVDLPIPVFPAGGIAGMVNVTDSTPIPAGTVLAASANSPRPDAPNDRDLLINQGAFAGTLLDGTHTLAVEVVDGTTPYSGSAQVTVVREQIVGNVTVEVAP